MSVTHHTVVTKKLLSMIDLMKEMKRYVKITHVKMRQFFALQPKLTEHCKSIIAKKNETIIIFERPSTIHDKVDDLRVLIPLVGVPVMVQRKRI